MFGLRPVWKDQQKILISDPHKTIIDMFDDPSISGGIRSTIDFFEEYLSSSEYDPEILIQYALNFGNKSIFKRMGFVLSQIKKEDSS